MASLKALERRGLVMWQQDSSGSSYKLHCTKEGRYVLQLIMMAGLLPDDIAKIVRRDNWRRISRIEERIAVKRTGTK
jgi:hypothetical protein